MFFEILGIHVLYIYLNDLKTLWSNLLFSSSQIKNFKVKKFTKENFYCQI
jgi:hypothetical protein